MKYIYAIYATTTFVILFLLLFPLFLVFGWLNLKKSVWYIIKLWSVVWFLLLGMNIQRKFIEKPSSKKTYVVIANHYSYLDTALIFRTFPFMVAPLAMAELAKVPLFGFLYKKMAILVDRSNNKSKAESLKKLKATILEGNSILIFPEGSFNKTDMPIKGFYDGAFKLALETQTDILPVLFPDTNKRWNNNSFWHWSPGRNRVVFLPEIKIADYKEEELLKLKDDAYQIMAVELKECLDS